MMGLIGDGANLGNYFVFSKFSVIILKKSKEIVIS